VVPREGLARPEAVPWLRGAFGKRVVVGEPAPDGRIRIELRSWAAHTLASELASFAELVEVLRPGEVRAELARIGGELASLYAGDLGEKPAVAVSAPART
jgi:WYL domain